jgi:HSP20 family protein
MTTLFPMTRMLDSVLNGALDSWTDSENLAHFVPRADVLEGQKEYRIVMDLPGVRHADLDINLEGQELTVKADKDATVPEGFEVRRNERSGKVQFTRTFTLGNAVDSEKIEAALDSGVLTITLPKSDVSLPRRIQVK